MAVHWSVHQLTEYLSEVSAQQDEATAVRVAVERAAEALDAELAAVAVDGGIRYLFGLGRGEPPAGLLATAAAGGALDVPGLGSFEMRSADLGRHLNGVLLVGRADEPLEPEEQQMLHGMARMLGLAVRGIRVLEAERMLREQRERESEQRLELLNEVRARQRLVETLLEIQRVISSRRPLQQVLDTITAGASRLFSDWAVSLVLTDPITPQVQLVASTHGLRTCDDAAVRAVADTVTASRQVACFRGQGPDGDHTLIAAPVIVDDEVAGTLAADLPTAADLGDQRDLLTAFAQQVSLALADARMVEAMREAFHDPLTGLANRALFVDLLDSAFAAGDPLAVLYIDLDGFKAVNDTLGHQAGDQLLSLVAKRISGCLRAGDTAARLGGDEFAVLLSDADDAVGADVGRRIIATVREPYVLNGREALVAASVGVARRRSGTPDAAALLGTADIAMYQAKQAGRGRVVVFDPAMRTVMAERDALQADLRRSVGSDDFRLLYQPVVRLNNGEPVAVEALLRWHHPVRGLLLPDEFIPLAEAAGVSRELGAWVLDHSARAVVAWRESLPFMRLHVNVSARQVHAPTFPADITAALAGSGLPGAALTLEITETALLSDPEPVLTNLREVRRAGVRISIDDFGTGYSSLSHLRQFPVDEIKIDHTFVAGMNRSADDLATVRAVTGLGAALGLPTVAEGIEDADQLAALRRLGCHYGQGRYLAEPLTPAQVDDYFARSGRRTARPAA